MAPFLDQEEVCGGNDENGFDAILTKERHDSDDRGPLLARLTIISSSSSKSLTPQPLSCVHVRTGQLSAANVDKQIKSGDSP